MAGCRIVESVGEGVTDMKEGDHVVPIFNGECGDCLYCKCEKTNMCERSGVNPFKTVMVSDGKSRFWSKEGKPIFHFLNTSTFSEYTVLESACVVKIDSQAPLKKMTLLSCGVSTGNNSAASASLCVYACLFVRASRSITCNSRFQLGSLLLSACSCQLACSKVDLLHSFARPLLGS